NVNGVCTDPTPVTPTAPPGPTAPSAPAEPAPTGPVVPEAPKVPALVEFEETIYVNSGITSNSKETTHGKFLKNSSNIKTYKTGEGYVVVPSTGTVKSFVQPGTGTVVNASGELRYTQEPTFKGTTKFSYLSTNAAGGPELHKVTVIVANKAPLLISSLASDTKTEQEAWTTTSKSLAFSSLDPNGDKYKLTIGTPSKDVKVTFTAGKLNLTAPRDFSGFVDVDVIATDADNAVTIVPARFVVNPGLPSASSVLTVSKELHMRSGLNLMFEFASVVNFNRSVNATGVSLIVNGVNQGNQDDHLGTIVLPEPAGVNDSIMLKMTGNDGTESAAIKVPVKVALGAPIARVNFATDSWALTTGAKKILNELASTSAHLNVTAFDLYGHADVKKGKNNNQTLSDKRAATVKSYLLTAMKKAGISDVHLSTQGLSDVIPFDASKTAAGLAANRRVEIFLPTV
ncbi:MAG: OmpA family protein, partial [Actinomycetes bacterium]